MDKHSIRKFVSQSGFLASYSGKKKMWFVKPFCGTAIKRPHSEVADFFTENNIPVHF